MRGGIKTMRTLSERMRDLSRQMSELNEQMKQLAEPTLSDYDLLPYIWSEFVAFSEHHGHNPMAVYERQKFLYASMLLYNPRALLGERMIDGLRVALSDAIGVSGTVISNNIRDVRFFYENYGEFSTEVDYFCAEISEKLQGHRASKRS